MRHRLLHATPLMAAILGIWSSLCFAAPTVHEGIEPDDRVVAQQERRGPPEPSLPTTYGQLPRLVVTGAIERRGGVYRQELGSNLFLHYTTFQPFRPSWRTAALFAEFWYDLSMQAVNVPDHVFLDGALKFGWGPLKLEILNASDGTGVPREFILALANVMMAYSHRGFCGMFNARVILDGYTKSKLWVSFRIA